jgi:hypothetical protein
MRDLVAAGGDISRSSAHLITCPALIVAGAYDPYCPPGATVRAEDLAGLRHLAQRLAARFVAGFVLYTGQQTLPFGDRLRALPIDALWHAAP